MDNKEGRTPKNGCFWAVVLEKTLESPLDCKEIQPVNPKGNKSWIFIRRTNAEAEAPILRPPDAKSRLTGKDPDAGKDRRQEEKGMIKNEMVEWHHWVWASSRKWWRTGKPGILQSIELQRVRQDWATELNWYKYYLVSTYLYFCYVGGFFFFLVTSHIVPQHSMWDVNSLTRDWNCTPYSGSVDLNHGTSYAIFIFKANGMV